MTQVRHARETIGFGVANLFGGFVHHFILLTFCFSPSGDDYLKQQGVDASELWYDEIALGSMTCIYLFFAYIALRLIKKEK